MSAILDRLGRLDACTVSDAMDALGLPPSVPDILRLSGEGVLAGRVLTVQLAEGRPDPAAPGVHLGATAITRGTAETVIVVAHPGIDAGGWGGVLSNAAQAAGIRGVIVDGPARDIDEARQMGFTVFARRATARTARGRVHEVSTGQPITVAGVTVAAGDYVIADASGTIFIPGTRIEDVLATAESIAEREARMITAVRAGTPVTEVMDAAYERMLEGRT